MSTDAAQHAVVDALRLAGHATSVSIDTLAEAAQVPRSEVAPLLNALDLEVTGDVVVVDLLRLPVPGSANLEPQVPAAAALEPKPSVELLPDDGDTVAASCPTDDRDAWELVDHELAIAARARHAGDLNTAVATTERARYLAANADEDTRARTELELGSLFEELGRTTRAADAYRRAGTAADPRLAGLAWRLAAEVLRVDGPTGQPAAAIDAYWKAAALSPDPDERALSLARLATLLNQQGQPADARAALAQAAAQVVDPALRADISSLALDEPPSVVSEGFSGPRAAEIVGATYHQLDYWARTELIRPSIDDVSRSGGRRRYAYRDLVELKVVKNLLDAGIQLESVRDAFRYLRQHLTDDITSVNLVISGHSSVLVRSGEEIIDLLRDGQGVLNILPLAGVKEEIDTGIARLPGERDHGALDERLGERT